MTELQINYFMAVAKEASYTIAAKKLHVTQPSISYQIKALENEFGITLFNRSGRNRLTLTPAGTLLLEHFQKMRQEFQAALLRATELEKQDTLSIRIGVSEGWDIHHLMYDTEDAIHQSYPQAQVFCETNSFKDLRARLTANELDVILCVQTCLTNFDGILVETVNETTSTLFYSSSHPAASKDYISLSDFENDPYYVLPDDETPLSKDRHHAYMLSHMIKPKIIEMPNRDSIVLALTSGHGYAIFDSWTRYQKQSDLSALPLDFTIPVCAVRRTNNHNPLIPIFTEECKKAFVF